MKQYLFSIIAYVFCVYIRVPFSKIMRVIMREWPVLPVRQFKTVTELQSFVGANFVYGNDPLWGMIDYVSHEGYMQFLLNGGCKKGTGDCDDIHNYIAHACSFIPGCTHQFLLSVLYDGGGHTVAVIKWLGDWYLWDYRLYLLNNINNAPEYVAKRHTPEGIKPKVLFYLWESVKPWKPLAINREMGSKEIYYS